MKLRRPKKVAARLAARQEAHDRCVSAGAPRGASFKGGYTRPGSQNPRRGR